MPTITALRARRARKDRVDLYLDDEWAFSLSLDVAAGLRKGQALSEAEIAALCDDDAYRMALGQMLRWLGLRLRSTSEIETRLAQRGVAPSVVARVIARLGELRLIDDAAFAEWWVAGRSAHRPKGARGLAHELRARGIAPGIIAGAVAGLDEQALATRLAVRLAPRYARADRPAFERRLGGLLARRGFAPGVIRSAIDTAWAGASDTDRE